MSAEIRSAGIRRRIVALIALIAISTTALPAAAVKSQEETANAPIGVDLLLMRPVGFLALIAGTGLFVISTPLVLITRPHEIGKPFKLWVVRPAKFLWADPLGGH